jgi:hypothetical protein
MGSLSEEIGISTALGGDNRVVQVLICFIKQKARNPMIISVLLVG